MGNAPPRCSVDSGSHAFHYVVEEGVTYMVLCHAGYPKKLAFAFLEEIVRDFGEEMKREWGSGAVDLRSKIETIEKDYFFIRFDRRIQTIKKDYKDPTSIKSMAKLNDSLNEVQGIMRRNLDEILQRGENWRTLARR